jgi:serine protease Do
MLAPTLLRSYSIGSAAVLLVVATASTSCVPADQTSLPGSVGAPIPSFAPLVERIRPAVVNVSALQRVSKTATDIDERRGRSRGPGPKVTSMALGSGFVIDPSGYVVTDDHVIEDAETVTIVVQDEMEYPARVVGRDPLSDLALLKIEPGHPLSYAQWGDSDAARVGDWVLAIGNPYGLENTVSSGIISGRGRNIGDSLYDDFLQIDAAMNRGNSGGPTFDLHGNVIGINTAIYSPNGGSVGIGFAIPANRAKPVLEELKAYGKVARGWLGIEIQPVTPEIARILGLANAGGALVVRVAAGSPAAAAGFEPGDVILSVNQRDVRRMRDLPLVIAELPIGEAAVVIVRRRNSTLSLRPVIGQTPTKPELAEMRPHRPAAPHAEPAKTAPVTVATPSLVI